MTAKPFNHGEHQHPDETDASLRDLTLIFGPVLTPLKNDAVCTQAQTCANAAPSEQVTSSARPQRMCSTCKQVPARKGQWDCLACHREAVRRSRDRSRCELIRLHTMLDDLTVKNRETQREFERKVGKKRFVLLKTCDGDLRIECFVIGFLPRKMLSVMTDTGQVRNVPLDLVDRDRRTWHS